MFEGGRGHGTVIQRIVLISCGDNTSLRCRGFLARKGESRRRRWMEVDDSRPRKGGGKTEEEGRESVEDDEDSPSLD